MTLTAERLRKLVHYDPNTGLMTWREHRRPSLVAQPIGWVDDRVRRVVRIYGKHQKVARLAWLYVHGEWPSGLIDHANLDVADNRIANLRDATHAENCANRKKDERSRQPFKGICFNRGRWQAQIGVARRRIFLGQFDTAEEAHAAYVNAARHHFGAFARTA